MKAHCCLFVAAVGLLFGCGSRWGGIERAPGSALWVAGGVLDAPALGSLEGVGIRELFVEAGVLSWEGTRPRVAVDLEFSPPKRLAATLVIRGPWTAPTGSEKEAATDLAAELGQLIIAAEAKGLFAGGIHFDFTGLEEPGEAAELLDHVRGKVDKRLLVSISLPRELITHSDVRSLTKQVDFVVAHLYGQRVGEPELPEAWDFQKVESALDDLEKLEEPYLLGISTLGSVAHVGSGGREIATTTKASLGDLVSQRGLQLEHGFTLQGIDRQVYAFKADRRVRIAELEIAAGERVRLIQASTPHLEELSRLLGAWNTPHRLGQIYLRMLEPGEKSGLTVGNIVNALGPSPTMPDPEVVVESLPPSRRALRLKVRVENKAGEPTDIGFVDHNYVELVATNAHWADVEPGDYVRYDLLKPDRQGTLTRSIQSPTVLRLYVPILEGGQVYQSDVIELVPTSNDPRLSISADFLVPSGRSATFGPREWSVRQ